MLCFSVFQGCFKLCLSICVYVKGDYMCGKMFLVFVMYKIIFKLKEIQVEIIVSFLSQKNMKIICIEVK